MDSVLNDIESIRKKFESLDRELDTFLEAFREMNEIKGSIADLPDKIKKHETDLADRKMEIEKLLTATSNTLMDFEERSKGLLFDLEKRTEALALKTKPGHANDIETPATQLSDEQMARIDQIIKSYEQILTSFESYRDMLDSHEESLHVLKNRHDDIIMTLEKINAVVSEINRPASPLPAVSPLIDDKLIAIEKKLRDDFFTKLDHQKNIILAVLVLLIAWIISFFFFQKF